MRLLRAICTLLSVLGLLACDVPSPTSSLAGTKAQMVDIQGDTFSVRISGSTDRAVRTNFNLRAKQETILPKAGLAIEQVSGCRVRPRSLSGDVAQIDASLDC